MTGLFLGSAAWTLLDEDVELDGGFFTPACLGQGFIDRARVGGFKLDVKISER